MRETPVCAATEGAILVPQLAVLAQLRPAGGRALSLLYLVEF